MGWVDIAMDVLANQAIVAAKQEGWISLSFWFWLSLSRPLLPAISQVAVCRVSVRVGRETVAMGWVDIAMDVLANQAIVAAKKEGWIGLSFG